MIASLPFAFPPAAYAVQSSTKILDCANQGDFNALCSLKAENFGPMIATLITFAFILAVILALMYLVWGGIKWITSGGDKTNVETARNHIVAAIIGLVLVFLSYFILNLVLYFFLGQSLVQLTFPRL